ALFQPRTGALPLPGRIATATPGHAHGHRRARGRLRGPGRWLPALAAGRELVQEPNRQAARQAGVPGRASDGSRATGGRGESLGSVLPRLCEVHSRVGDLVRPRIWSETERKVIRDYPQHATAIGRAAVRVDPVAGQ